MAEEVGITRQGFHEHYKSIDDAIIKGGDKLIEEYRHNFYDKFKDNKVEDRLATTALRAYFRLCFELRSVIKNRSAGEKFQDFAVVVGDTGVSSR